MSEEIREAEGRKGGSGRQHSTSSSLRGLKSVEVWAEPRVGAGANVGSKLPARVIADEYGSLSFPLSPDFSCARAGAFLLLLQNAG